VSDRLATHRNRNNYRRPTPVYRVPQWLGQASPLGAGIVPDPADRRIRRANVRAGGPGEVLGRRSPDLSRRRLALVERDLVFPEPRPGTESAPGTLAGGVVRTNLRQERTGTRLPSIVAFWIMSLCLYAFLRRRLPFSFAIAGMLFPLLTSAARFSYEARPYGLVLGLAGVALVCWQAAADGRKRPVALPGLAASLAAALCCHPLAVTLALPFLAGEVTRSIQRRRLDVLMWCAFAAATPPLWILWKLKSAAHAASFAQNVVHPLYTAGLTYFLILLPRSFQPPQRYSCCCCPGPIPRFGRRQTVECPGMS